MWLAGLGAAGLVAIAAWEPVAALTAATTGGLALAWWHRASQATQRAQAGLVAEVADVHLAVELADVGMWSWDLRTNVIHYSRSASAMLGYAPGEIASSLSAWGKLVHPDDLPRARRAIDDLVVGRAARYEQIVRLRAADGRWIPILDRGRITARDAEGRPERAVGVHVDISGERVRPDGRVATRDKVVIVDDDDDARPVLEAWVRQWGLPVVGFGDPQEAWDAIVEGGAPLAVVTADDLPGMTGVQLATRLRDAGHGCRILLMSHRDRESFAGCTAIDGVLPARSVPSELQPWLATLLDARA